MIDWEERYRELENQIEQMLIKVGATLKAAEEQAERSALNDPANSIREIIVDNRSKPSLVTVVADGIDMEYSLYLYGESNDPAKYAYQRNNTFSLKAHHGSLKRIKAFARSRSNEERLGVKHLDLTK